MDLEKSPKKDNQQQPLECEIASHSTSEQMKALASDGS